LYSESALHQEKEEKENAERIANKRRKEEEEIRNKHSAIKRAHKTKI
jgi:hypothetical protein